MSSATTQPFTLRPARFSDLPRLSHICTLAFWNDAIFGDIIHPNRHKYPADNDLYWLRRARVNFWDWKSRFLVTTVIVREEEVDTEFDQAEKGLVGSTGAAAKKPRKSKEREVITGVAQWMRMGDGGNDLDLRWWDPRNLLRPFFQLYNTIANIFNKNRAASPTDEDIIERADSHIKHKWSGSRAESWYLCKLAVDPAYGGLGHGRALVKWGIEKAEEDGVCASVISAKGKERFYQMCGFDQMDGNANEGEENPLAGSEGGVVFFKDV